MVPRAQVGWPLLRRAAAALALILAYCAIGPAAARADVAPKLWLPTSADLVRTLRPCTEKLSAPTPPICWSVREDLSAWMALPPGSPYPWGQCVYYAGLMRPDIWNDRAPPSIDRLDDWDAWTWAAHAQAEGLSVDGNPRPGDLMVYSGRALGNATGHLAIVDAVGGTTATSGSLLVTVSEMNVQGLDDPTRGQGDTMTMQLRRSRLVPGMIQFIHLPSSGYVPPVWAGGTGAADAGASPPSVAGGTPSVDPSLAAGLLGDRLETVSESAAPERAVVTSTASGRTVATLRLTPNRVVTLHLPPGSYRVCVTQPATGRWMAARGCASGSWAPSGRRSHRARSH
jgi:surface antigen